MYYSEARTPASAISSLGAFWRQLNPTENVLTVGVLSYLILGSLFLLATGSSPLFLLEALDDAFILGGQIVSVIAPYWMIALGVVAFVAISLSNRSLLARLVPFFVAVVYCTLFVSMFSVVKNSMHVVTPFWADAAFSRLDQMLHFGRDPHDFFFWLAGYDTSALARFYINSWVVLATFFPAILIACDPDSKRRMQFIVLWMAAWVVLGNVVAVFFLSYGPIFSDLFGQGVAEAHSGALALLDREDAHMLREIKVLLWSAYTSGNPRVGTGISAFPSVHVGMATVIGLYVIRIGYDVARRLSSKPHLARALRAVALISAALYILTYFALSVYLGWHYALDGYASFGIIVGLYWAMQRRSQDSIPGYGQNCAV
ncbi:phosphatase PAP2 family protein [Celeribacter sp.]|uniref:phosphatase PAP2 family protein n=1 Tax=Celeribacter sp. TaxID=1890673 RepID=UPI003A8D2EB6